MPCCACSRPGRRVRPKRPDPAGRRRARPGKRIVPPPAPLTFHGHRRDQSSWRQARVATRGDAARPADPAVCTLPDRAASDAASGLRLQPGERDGHRPPGAAGSACTSQPARHARSVGPAGVVPDLDASLCRPQRDRARRDSGADRSSRSCPARGRACGATPAARAASFRLIRRGWCAGRSACARNRRANRQTGRRMTMRSRKRSPKWFIAALWSGIVATSAALTLAFAASQ